MSGKSPTELQLEYLAQIASALASAYCDYGDILLGEAMSRVNAEQMRVLEELRDEQRSDRRSD